MFQLYKKRNFNAIFNDTFSFFRDEGKSYFGAYLKFISVPMVLLTVLIYTFSNFFFKSVFTGLNNPQQSQLLDDYFNSNVGFFIFVGVLCGLLVLLISAFSYAFPVKYLHFVAEGKKPDNKELLWAVFKSFGKILLFVLCSLITFLPIAAIMALLSGLLIMIIVGIPVALLLFGFLICWANLTFYDYLTTDNGFFRSLGVGYSAVFSKFWPNVGATSLFIIILYVIQTVASIIPYMIVGFMSMTDVQNGGSQTDAMSTMGIMIMVSFIISIILGYFLSNFLLVNQGIIYYSYIDATENTSLNSEIDLIGADIE